MSRVGPVVPGPDDELSLPGFGTDDESEKQLAFADVIIINKTDLVPAAELDPQVTYLLGARNSDGGWPFVPGGPSSANLARSAPSAHWRSSPERVAARGSTSWSSMSRTRAPKPCSRRSSLLVPVRSVTTANVPG